MVLALQEFPRLQTPKLYLDRYITLIKVWVPLVPVDLIFNLDETNLSDWEQRKAKPIFVPITMNNSLLHCPTDRGIRHATLLCCILESGDAYCPLLVCSGPSALSVFQMGVRDAIDLELKIQPSRKKSFSTTSERCS